MAHLGSRIAGHVTRFMAGVRAWFELCYAVPPGC
jgi:hypothetical protein